MGKYIKFSAYLKTLPKAERNSYDGLCRCVSCEEVRFNFNRLNDLICKCGHLKFKHLHWSAGCNAFCCPCDSFVVEKEHSLENANADDFNSSAASKDGGFLERLG